jgi:hypothetical protein
MSAAPGGLSATSGALGTDALGQTTGSAPSAPAMPLSNFQITLPAPTPYPTQYRSYTSVSGLDSNQPQQIDAQMAGLIDGADESSTNSAAS